MSQITITLKENGELSVQTDESLAGNKIAVLGILEIAKQAVAQQPQPQHKSPIAVARAMPTGPLRNGS